MSICRAPALKLCPRGTPNDANVDPELPRAPRRSVLGKALVDAKARELRESCGWRSSYGPLVSKTQADKRRAEAEAQAKRRAPAALRIQPAFDTVRDHSNPKFRSAR